ncbi:hypothetical protein HJG60_009230 [Phyllostomus discolor]|uniref:Uncharacterized protein n=1 Tax=Phyllostomus discolor TaxID=89673 RepID=A0A833YFR5_9CHIR|nr:hypothetical protein HJG60_009230 [Phyllostomus discolor]
MSPLTNQSEDLPSLRGNTLALSLVRTHVPPRSVRRPGGGTDVPGARTTGTGTCAPLAGKKARGRLVCILRLMASPAQPAAPRGDETGAGQLTRSRGESTAGKPRVRMTAAPLSPRDPSAGACPCSYPARCG